MRVRPVNEAEIEIMPETEVEAFYINNFLKIWGTGFARLSIKGGIMGANPQMNLEFQSKAANLIPFVFEKK